MTLLLQPLRSAPEKGRELEGKEKDTQTKNERQNEEAEWAEKQVYCTCTVLPHTCSSEEQNVYPHILGIGGHITH